MMTEDGDERTIKSLGVCDQLVKACESLGWKTPSKIQVEAIPHALEGRDVIVLAQTGSCKTGAFTLPIIQALLEKPQPFFACILSLTRELAIQISPQFEALGSSIGVKSSVVGTPGRLLDHLSNTKGFSLRMLKYLVLDEADRLLNMEFETAIDDILKDIPRERRTYLFSATMTRKVGKLQRACLKNPVKIEASSKYSTVDTLKQQFRLVPAKYKVGTLGRLLDHLSNTKGFSLRMLKYLVLDEADRLLNMDFEKAIDDILKAIPRERRTYLFSATMTKKVGKLQRACLKNPVKIEASSKYSTVDTLKQQFRLVPAKYKVLYKLSFMLIRIFGLISSKIDARFGSCGILQQSILFLSEVEILSDLKAYKIGLD